MDRSWEVTVAGMPAQLVLTETKLELRREDGVQTWLRPDGVRLAFPAPFAMQLTDGSRTVDIGFRSTGDQRAFRESLSQNATPDAPAAKFASGDRNIPVPVPAGTSVAQPAPTAGGPSTGGTTAGQTWKPGDVANGHVLTQDGKWVPVSGADDAAALDAYRQQAIRYRESITGWKPLVFWYGFWMIVFGLGTLSALFSGEVGVFFVGLVITGLLFLYARYLFRGGTRRVWFVIF